MALADIRYSRLGYVALNVSDLERSSAFYRTIVGLEQVPSPQPRPTAEDLIGAGFTMRHQRGGRVGVMVLGAILLSFGVYFLRNFAQILGENGQIPPALAAWAPPVAAILSSLGLLLHLEDG